MDSLGGLGGQFWSTLIGAVVGGIIAGAAGLVAQIYGVRAARKERSAANYQQDLATSLSVMVKVIKIVSYVGQIKALLDYGLSQLPNLAGGEPWQAVRPFGNTPAELTFSQDEAAFILSTKEKRLMLATLELGDRYNDFLHMIALYSAKRDSMTNLLPVGAMAGSMAPSHLDAEALTILRPQMFQLNELITVMVDAAAKDYEQARQIFGVLKAHCEGRFGERFPKLELT